MINLWRRIETLPKNNEPFLAARSIVEGRKNGGVMLRRAQIFTKHEYEQFVQNEWHPTLFRSPKYWMRQSAPGPRASWNK